MSSPIAGGGSYQMSLRSPTAGQFRQQFLKSQFRRLPAVKDSFSNLWRQKGETDHMADISFLNPQLSGNDSLIPHVTLANPLYPIMRSGYSSNQGRHSA